MKRLEFTASAWKSHFPLVTPQLRTMEIILPDCGGFLPIPNTNCRGSRQSVTFRWAAVFFLPGGYEHKTSQKNDSGDNPSLGQNNTTCSADAFRAKTTPGPELVSSLLREDTQKPSP
ncbi:hypothetical protein BDV33DRAFT_180639 [Aspergillus novoparasiticus]|uniref:Uncharacterized protein n=1 Tax=Aspergillus novoparasiticus TaxID=986946 RepID=A0A5N6EDC8_9EURO|nr:hypothetical protein BDV33DRAFT_180639 [Aspergillus novoparasiticus]